MRTMFDQVTTCISLDCLECRCPCVKAHRLRFSFFQQTDTILNEVGGFYKKKCECWNLSKHNASSLSSLSPIQPAQDRKGTRHFSKSNEHFKPWHQSKLWFSPWFYDKSISGGFTLGHTSVSSNCAFVKFSHPDPESSTQIRIMLAQLAAKINRLSYDVAKAPASREGGLQMHIWIIYTHVYVNVIRTTDN